MLKESLRACEPIELTLNALSRLTTAAQTKPQDGSQRL